MKTRTSDFKATAPLAYRTTQLLYDGRNMQAFLVGRQFLVALMMVLLSRVLSYAGSDGNLVAGGDWGMPQWFNEWLLQTGFLGALFVVSVAQLASQVTASLFPVSFMNNHFIHWLVRFMLLIEFSGVVNACWPLTWACTALFRVKKDPFDEDENVETMARLILERKRSMGIPVAKSVMPFDLHQPEDELVGSYRVSYI